MLRKHLLYIAETLCPPHPFEITTIENLLTRAWQVLACTRPTARDSILSDQIIKLLGKAQKTQPGLYFVASS
jgi:hypothetical protein